MARTSERLYVARSGTSATVTTPVSIVANTPKTVIGVMGTAATTISLVRLRISFDGVTSTDKPATIEVGIITAAGTVGTAFTPVQLSGSPMASVCAAGYNHSVEPTYTRIVDSFYGAVLMGTFSDWTPLGEEVNCAVSQGLALRVTTPAAATTVNCLASILYAE